ncbi:hypothetical protein [Deferrisoma sp.]
MHRTQVLLEDRQYLALKERARREGKSLGQLVREFVDLGLARGRTGDERPCRPSLAEVRGLFADGLVPEEHDRVLYGDP